MVPPSAAVSVLSVFSALTASSVAATGVSSFVAALVSVLSSVLLPHPANADNASTPARIVDNTFFFIIVSSLKLKIYANLLLLLSAIQPIRNLHSDRLENLE